MRARHGERVVRDDEEARFGALQHRFQEIAEALDIVIIQRRVDFIEHADRRGIGEEHREDERQRRQRLLAA